MLAAFCIVTSFWCPTDALFNVAAAACHEEKWFVVCPTSSIGEGPSKRSWGDDFTHRSTMTTNAPLFSHYDASAPLEPPSPWQ